jgi:hypothetical protein
LKRLAEIAVASFLILGCPLTTDGQTHAYFSPGLKLGYVFGEKGGFNMGIEASLTFESNQHNPIFYGIVISHDQCAHSEWSRIHVGLQASGIINQTIGAGVEIGPTWIYGKEFFATGFTGTAFAGGFLFTTVSYHHFVNEQDSFEPGFLAKIHIPLYPIKF